MSRGVGETLSDGLGIVGKVSQAVGLSQKLPEIKYPTMDTDRKSQEELNNEKKKAKENAEKLRKRKLSNSTNITGSLGINPANTNAVKTKLGS